MKGEVDGIDLSHFEVNRVYDMGTSLANYLMASGYAEPVVDERPALVMPPVDIKADTRSTDRSIAADKPTTKRRRTRNT